MLKSKMRKISSRTSNEMDLLLKATRVKGGHGLEEHRLRFTQGRTRCDLEDQTVIVSKRIHFCLPDNIAISSVTKSAAFSKTFI